MAKKGKTVDKVKETPLMKQYNEIKDQYPDTILLFRVGDFYETFCEDAIIASKILGIVLTKRANGKASFVELAGFPHHSLETYLPKLVRAGERVAICDQLEDPKLTKTIVKRGVTEVVTPGIAVSDNVLKTNENNYLAAVIVNGLKAGVSFIDISTGEFFTCEGSFDLITKLVSSYAPTEVIYARSQYSKVIDLIGEKYYFYGIDDWVLETNHTVDLLYKVLDVKSLKGFGVKKEEVLIQKSAGLCLHYLKQNHVKGLSHIKEIHKINFHDFLWMDDFTIRNLELVRSNSQDGISLIEVIDLCVTSMGGRTIRKWMVFPSIDKLELENRYDLVEVFLENNLQDSLIQKLNEIRDINRIVSKVSLNKINPKELSQLQYSLKRVLEVSEILENELTVKQKRFILDLSFDETILELLDTNLEEDPAIAVGKGKVIKDGISKELDEYRSLSFKAKDALLEIQQREIENTGIVSLKIAYNNVFGYYLEVRNAHKDKVPSDWTRKQTLTQAERYITPELKEFETKILSAEDKILQIESKLLQELIEVLKKYCSSISKVGDTIGVIDTLLSFSRLTKTGSYCRPKVVNEVVIDISNGRHPVIEKALPVGDSFIPNDVHLDSQDQQIIMVTGPNMSGKSAILRQTAIITIMAQMGAFVPADKFVFGLVDKVYTRVGASDNISAGESTFMVEMTETATILNNLTSSSLVLLDEIGRGTSTYDGVSIAQSIAEYLHDNIKARPLTLFATHYHELNKLSDSRNRIKNFNVSVKETKNGIIFLRKLMKGGSHHSFGIHVAKMAGIPVKVVDRAQAILLGLEKKTPVINKTGVEISRKKIGKENGLQLSFIQLDDPVLEGVRDEIKNVDINNLTPIEALNKLSEIKKLIGN